MQSQTLTRKQAAERLSIRPCTLQKWARSNPPRGPVSIKLGTTQQARHLYLASEVDRWLADPHRYEADRPGRNQPNQSHDHDPTRPSRPCRR